MESDRQDIWKQKLQALEEKYGAMGQDMLSYLDGLLHADYLTYWDYIELDTLLSLQKPRTSFPDEYIFITYHQITELYFKLIRQAIRQVTEPPHLDVDLFHRQLERINRYFEQLIRSFDIMVDGMDGEEFLKFRMSLLPASGFQSAQFREIEIMSTDFYRLVHPSKRNSVRFDDPMEEIYPLLYWKSGATELATGQKTLTLRQFERKYSRRFLELAHFYRNRNLWQCYLRLPANATRDQIGGLLRQHDFNVNIRWSLAHLKSAVRHLDNNPEEIKATGGTNWQEYLPPKFQQIVYYPDLWTQKEREHWGRKTRLE